VRAFVSCLMSKFGVGGQYLGFVRMVARRNPSAFGDHGTTEQGKPAKGEEEARGSA